MKTCQRIRELEADIQALQADLHEAEIHGEDNLAVDIQQSIESRRRHIERLEKEVGR